MLLYLFDVTFIPVPLVGCMLYLFDIYVNSLFDSSIDALCAFIGVSSVIVYIMCDVYDASIFVSY